MNVVVDEAILNIPVKKGTKRMGRIMLKGDNIT